MQTAFLYKPGHENLVRSEIPIPKAGRGEVVLEIKAAGMCHSDLHVLDGGIPLPGQFVMGHEIVGTIHEIGQDVTGFKQGDLYAVHGPNPCGICTLCREGFDNDCTTVAKTGQWFGLGLDGGYQKYIRIPNVRSIVKVPEGVSAEAAASCTDAVLTPYRALKQAGASNSTRVLILGLGGLGLNALKLAKTFGSYVYASDLKPSAREAAKAAGADEVLESLPEDPLGVDIVLDVVGVQSTFNLAQKHVGPRGIIVPVGLASPQLSFNLTDLALREIRVQGTFWGTSNELAECLRLCQLGLINPKYTVVPLEEAPKYMEAMAHGKVEGRIVFHP
ncbi:hypothetical protein CANCADRAFT_56443 [Tortispora caseinolytica NRRL Y-17796]|uniref:Enoyl reductase (ER) domain-containing protein n=1 Tax=Tortispora caseinolytica NRRL Y-17796 TaxID=767744 RepID=A0A1E4TMA4_9ASCO|nr:hypothetical protein CANCADRAFT_56443 [Tortispora caseinolytica NRRL Y-17796]